MFFQCFLGFTNVGDLWVCIDHTGNDAVVHVAMFARDLFGGGKALIFGFVREHWSVDHVANCVDTWHIGLPIGPNFDLTAWGHFDP